MMEFIKRLCYRGTGYRFESRSMIILFSSRRQEKGKLAVLSFRVLNLFEKCYSEAADYDPNPSNSLS